MCTEPLEAYVTAGLFDGADAFLFEFCKALILTCKKFMASERWYKKQADNERVEFKNTVLNLIY